MARSNPQWNMFQPPAASHHLKSYPSYPGPTTGGAPALYSQFSVPAHQHYHSHHHQQPTSPAHFSATSAYPGQHPDTTGAAADFDIGVFSVGTFGAGGSSSKGSGYGSVNGFSMSKDDSPTHSHGQNVGGLRETGIIEKLLKSYGFIQCCDRQARLFFHFSQFDGNIEHLHIGDPVEFEMTYDRRNGKPVASTVSKITPEVTPQVLSEERVTGTVTTELRTGSQPQQGRISYENRGECFFLPYGTSDIEGNVTLCVGDLVSFQMATDSRTGNLAAHNVRLENPANPIHYQGMICSLQPDDRSGFIERADVVREIFFLYKDVKDEKEINLGDEVEFTIQTVQGKEVATNITHLEPGSVVFEDIDQDMLKGQVLKALDETTDNTDPMPGRVRYRVKESGAERQVDDVVEVPFGERDVKGSFTLRHGDWVQFNVATDRRDKLRRATNISLLEESFVVSGEKREQGVLLSVKEHTYGFIKCVERDQNLFFHLSEIIDPERGLQIKDEVEFTVVPDPNTSGRQTAIRIRRLPPGTVRFETVVQSRVSGVVSREPSSKGSGRSPGRAAQGSDKAAEPGLITYQLNGGAKSSIAFHHSATEPRNPPRQGDTVQFNIVQSRRTKELSAAEVVVTQRAAKTDPPPPRTANGTASGGKDSQLQAGSIHQGYVAALKEEFGFIETMQHDREIFFHYSNVRGEPDQLQLGGEVQYTLSRAGSQGRVSAENVLPLPEGTLPAPKLRPEVLDGIVLRPLRSVDPDQTVYAGLLQANTTDEVGAAYEFGIISLANKKEFLQVGDLVTFQVEEGGKRAANIKVHRPRHRATVDSIKGQFGFLSYEHEEGKKLFFHMSEIQDGVTLREGDEVEFGVVTSQRTGRSSACHVVRISAAAEERDKKRASNSFTAQSERPDRVIQRIRAMALDDQRPRQVLVLRQPRGPDDGSRGFTSRRPA